MHHKNKKGFTMVELMVVISIVSLLSSILAISLSASKARAQDTAKIADVNAMKVAVQAYKFDHDGNAPVPVGVSQSGDGRYTVFDNSPAFKNSLQPLVDGKYLASLPDHPLGLFYSYLNGSLINGEDEAVIGVDLQVLNPPQPDTDKTCRAFNGTFEDPPEGYSSCPVPTPGQICQTSPSFQYPAQCVDNNDNDNNRMTDMGDPKCVSTLDVNEYVDGLQTPEDPQNGEAACPAGYWSINNFDDGAYVECFEQVLNSPTACNDGQDNDNDGVVDMADRGCVNLNDNSEKDARSTICRPGVDYCQCI
jgi:general secretion pathway protein G